MIYDRQTIPSSGYSLTLTYGDILSNLDCHSMAINNDETHLLLVGSHSLAFVNLETLVTPMDMAGDDMNMVLPYPIDIKISPHFDPFNVNRPIIEWSSVDTHQYAVAIDRLVRLYTVDHARIQETSSMIDTQHQRPISTLAYWPREPGCIFTGSLDGQVQVWDTRHCSAKAPAVLQLTLSTPFSVRRIIWPSNKTDGSLASVSNQLGVQCDRSVRIYDIRRTDSCLGSIDLEHTQRLVDIDWTMQSRSIVTLSFDHSLRVFSHTGQLLAESISNESAYTMSKIRATGCDSLFISACRDADMSTYGFIGWRWDEDHYLRPLTDRILSSTPSPILDFNLVTSPRLLQLLSGGNSSRPNGESTNRFLLLAWCRDENLRLIDMDSTFRQAWMDHTRVEQSRTKNQTNDPSYSNTSSRSNLTRQQQLSRSSMIQMGLESIKDEINDCTDDDDDNAFGRIDASPPPEFESPETGDDSDIPALSNSTCIMTNTMVSIKSEMDSVQEKYGPYITVDLKDEQRRLCVVRCIFSLDGGSSFRIYLLLSRHYPIIAQLSLRFKLSSLSDDDRSKSLRQRIQVMLDKISQNCFYRGQLCLHICLLKLKYLFDSHHQQERSIANAMAHSIHRRRDESLSSFDPDSPSGIGGPAGNYNSNSTNSNGTGRMFGATSSSPRTSDSQISNGSFGHAVRRTCGARFAGGTHLVCFGRTLAGQQPSSAPVLSGMGDTSIVRPQSLPMRSTSLVATKSRGNSTTDEQSASYRPPKTTTTMHIQHVPPSQRSTIFSAPVRSSYSNGVVADHPHRISTSTTTYRRRITTTIAPLSAVSIYDVSILLPVSLKLADEYSVNLNDPIGMCEYNEQVTANLGKDELTHCWRLVGGLLSLDSNLQDNVTWFQTPIAQGLIHHLVSHYVADGDIQSASMFLLTMPQTRFMAKMKTFDETDPILYAYGSLLHRWKHFYKRTQILSHIDHNCQSPAPTNPMNTTFICVICQQPVTGQHFLCALCGHGGHLKHMHEWFSSSESKHRYCPEKDCACQCIIQQQECLTMNTLQTQHQQHTPTLTPRPSPYISRQPSGNTRPI